jgi:hypothetical protein
LPFDSSQALNLASMSTLTFGVSSLWAEVTKLDRCLDSRPSVNDIESPTVSVFFTFFFKRILRTSLIKVLKKGPLPWKWPRPNGIDGVRYRFLRSYSVNRNHRNDCDKTTLRRDETQFPPWKIGLNKFIVSFDIFYAIVSSKNTKTWIYYSG